MPYAIQNIDFETLMDLRVDYAFKLFFAMGDTRPLVSLLNSIFENKGIPRQITALTIQNPYLEKLTADEKLSILDVRATLSDGSQTCIEMHLYGLTEFKYKSMRTWARVYGEGLKVGQGYETQKPVICISFIDGFITDSHEQPVKKIHSLFQVMERDDHQVLLEDMEVHFINMRAFAEMMAQGKMGAPEEFDSFTRWLTLITQKEVADKEILRALCNEEARHTHEKPRKEGENWV